MPDNQSPDSMDQPTAKFYRHYKNGKDYQFICVALHTETKEKMVLYQGLYEPFEYFVRPHDMFFGEVEHEGKLVKRFEVIK